ncbi:HVA22-like protein K isoform 2 [Hibiscus syriacus]|uniref:HVA22-like protein K isoform 2 n=1 Tax=Hibiscus syriacus TaxID=106335 RepID=A0A6A2ZM89_HIBSY|nr:HVA22-like protein K isoform 2 [Hibiscus syriacus]
MALTNEVGLRLLFSPISSNIVVRTACCTVGTILPVYSTFKAIETIIKLSSKNGFFIGQGAKHLYTSHLRPLLLRHQAKLDKVSEFIYSEMTKIISAHQAKFEFARALFMKLAASVNQIVWDLIHPVRTPRNRSIGGPRQVDSSDTQSNNED